MPDDADELILKMQHLGAQARALQEAREKKAGAAAAVKSAAQRLALEAQQELEQAEAAARSADEKLQRAQGGGLGALEAADLLAAGKAEAQEAKARAVKARARLNYALDKMDQVERREWEAFQAEARAEAHGQLADDPLLKKG